MSDLTSKTSLFTYEENGGMKQSDFINLLIEELTHQDPLEPMDNQEFVNQMVQFSSLEQMTEMTQAVNNMSETTNSSMQALQMGMMGKAVTAEIQNPLYDDSLSPEEQEYEKYIDISGIIQKIKYVSGVPMMDIGSYQFTMDSIKESWIPKEDEIAEYQKILESL
jgi:flagellar basal-body rod modification protein FlgD